MQPLQVQHGADDGSRAMRRPMVRRTVDHAGPGLKMIKDRIFRPELRHAPVTMPSTEKAVREMLPPAASRSNATSGICSRFVHQSSNKDRCPVGNANCAERHDWDYNSFIERYQLGEKVASNFFHCHG